jgi:hypothetical protein
MTNHINAHFHRSVKACLNTQTAQMRHSQADQTIQRFRWVAVITLVLIFAATVTQAQLAVTVFPVKVEGQKALIPLTLANHLSTKIESARAVCFLLDE